MNIIGVKNLRFKPAYNPYTEPSMEIFSYHQGIKESVTFNISNYIGKFKRIFFC